MSNHSIDNDSPDGSSISITQDVITSKIAENNFINESKFRYISTPPFSFFPLLESFEFDIILL